MYRQQMRIASKDSRKAILWFLGAFLLMVLLCPSFSHAKTNTINKAAVSLTENLSFAWINVKGSHVRYAPEASAKSMEILLKGRLVIVLKKGDKWIKVQYEQGKTGWIFSKNLSFGIPKDMSPADRILLVRDGLSDDDKGNIVIFFNGRIDEAKIKTFTDKNPPKLIIDVKDLKSERNKRFRFSKTALVSEMRLGIHPKMTRFVLVLKRRIKKFSKRVSPERNALLFSLQFGSPVSLKKVAVAKKAEKEEVKNPVQKAKLIRIIKTGFKDERNRSIIVLHLTSKPSYYVKFLKGKVALLINNARIEKRYMRFFDTSAFPTPIKKVEFKNTRDKISGSRAEVWVTIQKMVPYDVQLSPGVLKWIFKKPKEFMAKAEAAKANLVKSKPSAKIPSVPSAMKVAPKRSVKRVSPQKRVVHFSPKTKLIIQKKKYTGAKMSFDFQNADIHNVLRLIAEVSNLNIVAGDDVRGKITLKLKNVPWDQALDIILQSKGLGKEQIGNVLRIAPKAKLKKEMQEKIASKKVVEKLEALKTEYIPVNYTTAKELSSKIKPMLSSRGTVTIDERTNTLIIKDIPKKISDVKNLVKKLDTPTPEVLIESRIVEAAKEFTREVGIKWGAKYNAGPQYGNPPNSNFPNQANVQGGGNTPTGPTTNGMLPMVDLPATAYGAIGVTLEQVVDIFSLDVELTAMEDNGLGKVISSPRIATLDNKTASIEQGLRIPYLKITEEGTVTTEFIEANLNLEVTPHVSNDKMINMEIKVSKDTPDWSHLVQGVPSIDKKEAITNVLVKDGGVTAIGGIFTIEKTSSIHKVPLFGDIPILGWAFKNKRTVKNRKELIIFISPKLIPLKGNR